MNHVSYFVALLFTLAASGNIPVDLPNPGYEQQLADWHIAGNDNGFTQLAPEAARNGQYGVRVTDDSPEVGSSFFSSPLPTKPGKTYKLRFWSRLLEGHGLAVYLVFYGDRGAQLNTQERNNVNLTFVSRDAVDWKPFEVTGVAPEGARTVKVWVHSITKSQVTGDIDDLSLVEVQP